MVTAAALIGKHRARARQLRTGEVEFSGPTYQVQVFDGEHEYWPFIQFEKEGEVRDALCACTEEGCVHVAAALLRILDEGGSPLHVRFEASLWNALCQLYDVEALTGDYFLESPSHKLLFKLETTRSLEGILENRPRETEENSLKFSGLSAEELARWREGRPTPHLRYELSFWSDLAKWLMLLQESEKYKITFIGEGLPSGIEIEFPDLKIFFYISEANLPKIIPTLATVQSPLKVHRLGDEAIEKITFESGVFNIVAKEEPAEMPEGIGVDGWIFVPEDGFYSEERQMLLSSDVDMALSEHQALVTRYLDEKVHTESVSLHYQLYFDDENRLHIRSYLFDVGENSQLFGRWAYLEEDGFYPIVGEVMPEVVPPEKLSEFIHTHRIWLGHQPGFETHLTPIEAHLAYEVDEGDNLHFSGVIDLPEGRDCDDWVYIPGQGFFAKTRARTPIRPGRVIPAAQVPIFIQAHREELELVDGFFTDHQPILRASLSVCLDSGRVTVTPDYELFPEYRDEDLRFFDIFVYIPDAGFQEIPPELRLPSRFAQPLTIQGKDLDLFLTYELDTLPVGDLDAPLQKPASLHVEAREAIDGQIDLRYRSSLGQVSAVEIWRAIDKGQRYLLSAAGRLDLHDARFQWMRQVPLSRLGRLKPLEMLRLSATERVDIQHAPSLKSLMKLTATSRPNITGLKSTLRPYQEMGLQWLWFLHSHGLSGLLCDDMGLGKTHQAMALMAAINNVGRAKVLVVCPTSVLYHWQEKLAAFLPGLNVLTYYGPGRSLIPCDLILTSYGTLRAEKKPLEGITFDLAVYDEVQMAKNPSSRTHAALAGVKAEMHLGLTGTPIENSLQELQALFSLVLPGYLPSRELPQKILQKIIQPFILRRKKEQVLTELPEKTEETAHCDLSPEQRSLYNSLLQRQRNQVISELEGGAYLHIFTVLTHLKQICDHPAAYLKTPREYRQHESGKWKLFTQLLSQARESNQKVVVFSQFLAMLDIIELHLQDQAIPYATIRGETRNRDRQLKRFHEDPSCAVFLGSLQAAGLGIDLTPASVVIHYDRWWNAARENQATDRVHRIGQTRGVQVFKLVTLGTLEERIDTLIAKKGALMEEVVGSTEQAQLKVFTKEELAELLALLD